MSRPAPLLLVIAGPARGRSVPVEGTVSIGRDEQSQVVIPDLALSRRHCEIETTGNGVWLRDLSSRNGSWVNGVPVTQHVLTDGDRIRIGDSALLFVHPADSRSQEPEASPAIFADIVASPASTIALPANETWYRRTVQAPGPALDAPRAARDLAALLRLSEALQRTASSRDLYTRLLAHALEVLSADAAAIIAFVAGTGELAVAAADRRSDLAMTIDRSTASQALTDRVAVLTDAPIRASLCAPVLTTGEPAQAIYVINALDRPRFTSEDLHLLAAIGAIGGLALDRVRHLEWLESENTRLRADESIDHQMIGDSAAVKDVLQFVARAAPTEATVLIRGESGTGKELVAHAVHANSPRARGPFVVINCAALPEPLLESELFGHERGAFTGAVAQQRGRIELAHGGTLFLDEIGELAPALQAKLLRVLQDHVVERIGGRHPVPIDVRIVAATNRDLEAAIASGEFRQDLYYRLNVVSIVVAPLRQRREDIPLLASYFVQKHAARCKRSVKGISPEARKVLLRYDWPGNVRELENAIERAIVLGTTDVIHPEDLPDALLESGQAESDDGFHARVATHKRAVIQEALDRAGGSVAGAARDLGLQPTYLHRLIRNLDLSRRATGSKRVT